MEESIAFSVCIGPWQTENELCWRVKACPATASTHWLQMFGIFAPAWLWLGLGIATQLQISFKEPWGKVTMDFVSRKIYGINANCQSLPWRGQLSLSNIGTTAVKKQAKKWKCTVLLHRVNNKVHYIFHFHTESWEVKAERELWWSHLTAIRSRK